MRTSKKFLSMILAIMMVVGALSAAASSYAFDDVEDYQSEIALMSELGIVVGKTETEFGYGADIERWQMALFIARMMTGKVYNDYVNWYETENYTTFQDINYDQAMGAISYGNDNGIIKGYSETEFGPTDGITIQDAFTMAVRMLGYGSSAMDATYPWSYVDKAIKLDLDALLPLDYNNEDIATKEQIVAILYQALFAPKADGTTIGASKFNLTMDTVVITGTIRGNMFTDAGTTKKANDGATNYVQFSLLNEDGTLQTGTSYYLPRNAFKELGEDDLAATLKIGYSYDIVTKDDFTTLLYSKENDTVVVDQDSLKGGDKDHRKDLTINSDAYKAVTSYSTLAINNQGTKTTFDYEVILYNGQGTNAAIGSPSYLRDSKLNIVDEKGEIILTYFAHGLTGATSYPDGVYLVETAKDSGIYRDPLQADWDKAHEAYLKAYPLASRTVYQAITDTFVDISLVNAYSDTILIDDNDDSDYDRGIYIYYSFGKIGVDKDGYLTADGKRLGGKAADYAYINIDKYLYTDEDYVIGQSDVVGQYALYASNPVTKVFYLKKTYETKIGYVTTVNKAARTITFDQVLFDFKTGTVTGTTYELGVKNLPGGDYNSVVVHGKENRNELDAMVGRTVNYIVDEKYSAVVRILDFNTDAGYVVLKNLVASTNTSGYVNAVGYMNDNVLTAFTIASINGYTNVSGAIASGIISKYITTGALFKAEKDALGMYHLWSVPMTEIANTRNLSFFNGKAIANGAVDGEPNIDDYGKLTNANTAKATFKTKASTVIILADSKNSYGFDGDTLSSWTSIHGIYHDSYNLPNLADFYASKGVPSTGSTITLNDTNLYVNVYDGGTSILTEQKTFDSAKGSKYIFIDKDSDGYANFVYIVDAIWGTVPGVSFNTTNTASTWLDSNNTIILIDKDTVESGIFTNQTANGLGVQIGTSYTYSNAIDVIRGGLKTVYTNALYNQRLDIGHFYYVKDGYVVGLADEAMAKVKLTWATSGEAIFSYDNGAYQMTDGSIVYMRTGLDVHENPDLLDYASSTADKAKAFRKALNEDPYAWREAIVYKGVIDFNPESFTGLEGYYGYNGMANVFITVDENKTLDPFKGPLFLTYETPDGTEVDYPYYKAFYHFNGDYSIWGKQPVDWGTYVEPQIKLNADGAPESVQTIVDASNGKLTIYVTDSANEVLTANKWYIAQLYAGYEPLLEDDDPEYKKIGDPVTSTFVRDIDGNIIGMYFTVDITKVPVNADFINVSIIDMPAADAAVEGVQ